MHEMYPTTDIDALRQQQAEAYRESATFEARNAHHDAWGGWNENRPLKEVLDDLPDYNGASLVDLIGETPPERRTILDLGCGDNAVALRQLVKSFEDGSVRGVGVTLPLDRPDRTPPIGVTVVRQDVDEFLRDLADRPEEERPSIMYSEKMFRWLPDPLGTLERAYAALPEGGHLLVDEIYNSPMPLVSPDGQRVNPQELGDALREAGYDITFSGASTSNGDMAVAYAVALRKNERATLVMPVRQEDKSRFGIPDEPSERWNTPFRDVARDTKLVYVLDTAPNNT